MAHLSGQEEVGIDAAQHRAAGTGANGNRLDRLLRRRLGDLDWGSAGQSIGAHESQLQGAS